MRMKKVFPIAIVVVSLTFSWISSFVIHIFRYNFINLSNQIKRSKRRKKQSIQMDLPYRLYALVVCSILPFYVASFYGIKRSTFYEIFRCVSFLCVMLRAGFVCMWIFVVVVCCEFVFVCMEIGSRWMIVEIGHTLLLNVFIRRGGNNAVDGFFWWEFSFF